MTPRTLAAMLVLGTVGCAHPVTLQPDFGTSYQTAFAAQADLEGPPLTAGGYVITGVEALLMRERAAESLTGAAGQDNLTINLNQ